MPRVGGIIHPFAISLGDPAVDGRAQAFDCGGREIADDDADVMALGE